MMDTSSRFFIFVSVLDSFAVALVMPFSVTLPRAALIAAAFWLLQNVRLARIVASSRLPGLLEVHLLELLIYFAHILRGCDLTLGVCDPCGLNTPLPFVPPEMDKLLDRGLSLRDCHPQCWGNQSTMGFCVSNCSKMTRFGRRVSPCRARVSANQRWYVRTTVSM